MTNFFPPGDQPVATSIYSLSLILTRTGAGSDLADYTVTVLDQFGEPIKYEHSQGDALPFLTAQEKVFLQTLMVNLFNKAELEILG
jgi:hypothetical protein